MDDARIVGMVSGKGGVGKTTITVNMGIALSEMGRDVTVIDTDFSASNLATYLGHYDHPVNIQDVLQGDHEPGQALFQHPSGIRAMTSSNEIDKVEPETSRLRDVLEAAAETSDYVLVDCAPGIDSKVNSVIQACNEIVVVTEPTQTSGVNAAQVVERSMELRKPVLGTVINKFEDEPDRELIEREVEIMTNSHIMSKVPYDKNVKESLFHNMPLLQKDPLTEASIEIKKLAAKLDGQEYNPPRLLKLKRKLRRLKDTMQR